MRIPENAIFEHFGVLLNLPNIIKPTTGVIEIHVPLFVES